jgi:hypothetical protein
MEREVKYLKKPIFASQIGGFGRKGKQVFFFYNFIKLTKLSSLYLKISMLSLL